jgi:peptidoglycan L-alanyl-D-glutamate endopeptidase CwlK
MASFSPASLEKLSTCDERLQIVLKEAIRHFDFTVTCGHRGQADQDRAVAEGKSKTPWPTSKHNSFPAMAVDVAPYPIDWNDLLRFAYLAGHIMECAAQMGIKLRWGGDWDRDTRVSDERFKDLPHFEIDGSLA